MYYTKLPNVLWKASMALLVFEMFSPEEMFCSTSESILSFLLPSNLQVVKKSVLNCASNLLKKYRSLATTAGHVKGIHQKESARLSF